MREGWITGTRLQMTVTTYNYQECRVSEQSRWNAFRFLSQGTCCRFQTWALIVTGVTSTQPWTCHTGLPCPNWAISLKASNFQSRISITVKNADRLYSVEVLSGQFFMGSYLGKVLSDWQLLCRAKWVLNINSPLMNIGLFWYVPCCCAGSNNVIK